MKREELNNAELACLELYEKLKKEDGFIGPNELAIYAAGEEISEKLKPNEKPLTLSGERGSVDVSGLVKTGIISSPSRMLGNRWSLSFSFTGSKEEMKSVYRLITGEEK